MAAPVGRRGGGRVPRRGLGGPRAARPCGGCQLGSGAAVAGLPVGRDGERRRGADRAARERTTRPRRALVDHRRPTRRKRGAVARSRARRRGDRGVRRRGDRHPPRGAAGAAPDRVPPRAATDSPRRSAASVRRTREDPRYRRTARADGRPRKRRSLARSRTRPRRTNGPRRRRPSRRPFRPVEAGSAARGRVGGRCVRCGRAATPAGDVFRRGDHRRGRRRAHARDVGSGGVARVGPPDESPEARAALRQLSKTVRESGWRAMRAKGRDFDEPQWYARSFRPNLESATTPARTGESGAETALDAIACPLRARPWRVDERGVVPHGHLALDARQVLAEEDGRRQLAARPCARLVVDRFDVFVDGVG